MKNDITRDTFNPLKHFSRVLMQQGRVQLDADWNEQVSILLHYLRTVTTDLIGPAGGPADAFGFGLKVADAVLSDDEKKEGKNVLITPGRYYVDGLVAENEGYVPFFDQPGKPVADDDTEDALETAGGAKVLLYLDVWERHVTPIEDDDIREKALGGPDTATRAKIAWVVRARQLTEDEETERGNVTLSTPPTDKELKTLRGALQPKFEDWSKAQLGNGGLLSARVKPQSKADDPCVISPESAYRGLENQLYRVEIHRGSPALDGNNKPATFKWSRDNGSVAASWLDTDGDVLRVTALHDQARGFSKGQWVELHGDHREMEGSRGTLVQLKDVEAGSLTIDPATASGSVDRLHFKSNPKVRRWDQAESETIKLDKGAVSIVEGKWIELEDGVQIQFQEIAGSGGIAPAKKQPYRTGDYWLIPARVATRDVEWPFEENEKGELVRSAMPPHGVTHHYALLGLLGISAAPASKFEFTDCRRKFSPSPSV